MIKRVIGPEGRVNIGQDNGLSSHNHSWRQLCSTRCRSPQ